LEFPAGGRHTVTGKQTTWTIFFIAVVTGLVLLSTIIKVDDQLERSRLAVIDMQKQIDKIKAEDEELKHLVVKLTNANLSLSTKISMSPKNYNVNKHRLS
jgi:cell division protein FtsL